MFANIRRYHLRSGSSDELARKVDAGFADQIGRQPGFVSYEFVDCGGGEVMTISIFREMAQAEASRDLAQRWADENLREFEFTRWEAWRGEILVSRAVPDILEPGHVGATPRFVNARRYALRDGSIETLMHKVDQTFADQIQGVEGFEAYHALDCGDGELLTISLFADAASAASSEDLARQFVREELSDLPLERTGVTAGEVLVSRAVAAVLEPAHA